MFTGIVAGVGAVTSVRRKSGGDCAIAVDMGQLVDEPELGESVALDGVCLTVVKHEGLTLWFDISRETLDKTTFGDVRPGAKVNVERALRMGDRLGGHMVSGHVDCPGKLISVNPAGEGFDIEVGLDPDSMKYVIEKGSIALSGISLTVARRNQASIVVAVIPHTYKETTLGQLSPGAMLNVEYDMMAKYVENFVNPAGGDGSRIDGDFLRRHGF